MHSSELTGGCSAALADRWSNDLAPGRGQGFFGERDRVVVGALEGLRPDGEVAHPRVVAPNYPRWTVG